MKRFSALILALLLALGGAATAQDDASGGTLNVGIVSDPVTLDPALMGSFFELSVQYLIHEPLLHMTPNLEIEPGLVESWTVEDNTVYNFQLRDGLTFHDGTTLDAEAVKANFDRVLDPDTGSPRASELGPVDSVEVTGPLSFTITLSQPYAPFLSVLTNRAGMMVSPTALEDLGEDFSTRAVGAGPFQVVEWVKNSELELAAFDNYWREGQPYLDRVVLQPLPDETVRLTNLRSGSLDLINGVPPQDVTALRDDASVQVFEQAGLGFNDIALNTTAAPFDDVRVRQALWHSIDPNVIQRVVYFDTGTVSYGPIPPAIPWAYDADFAPYTRDVERAQELLAAAGYEDGLDFTITVTNSPIQVRIAEIVQAQAAEAGFNVDIRQIDATSLITVLRGRDFDASWAPWSGRPDPDGNMFNYFTIDGPNNFAGWINEEVDALLNEARVTLDQDRRAELYRQAQTIIAEEAPLIFFHHDAILQAAADDVEGYRQWPDGAFHLEDVRLP